MRSFPVFEKMASAAPSLATPRVKESNNERRALEVLKRLALVAGMRERGPDGHRKRPSLEEMEQTLTPLIKKSKLASGTVSEGKRMTQSR